MFIFTADVNLLLIVLRLSLHWHSKINRMHRVNCYLIYVPCANA